MRAAFWISVFAGHVIAAATPVRAEGDAPIDCGNAVSTFEMNACADKDFSAADKALNSAYQKALKDVPAMATEKPYDAKSWETALRASQRAWLAFRDAECNNHVAMFWSGGTGATTEILGCMTDKTKARTKELNDHYDNK